jgi:ABC-type multidrug transport system fused ATPase/permease subunit
MGNETEMDKEIINFKNTTHQMNNFNEIYNLNVYLKNSSTQDIERLQSTNETLKSRVIKAKQEYVLQDRMIHFMGLKNGLMYYTLVITCIILLVVGFFLKEMLAINMMVIIVTVIIVIFIVSVVFITKSHSDRRNIIWDQYYWKPMKKEE